MSSNNSSFDAFVRRMVVLYGEPETIDLQAYLDEFRDVLKGVSEMTMRAVGDGIRDRHTRRSWPSPADVRDALKAVRTFAPSPAQQNAIYPGWNPEKDFPVADDLCISDTGREAARDGWLAALHNFAGTHKRLPSPREKATLIADSRFVDGVATGTIDAGICGPALRDLAINMVKRRDLICERLSRRAQGKRSTDLTARTRAMTADREDVA